jgi:1,4-alpha-glucan branching enzyme
MALTVHYDNSQGFQNPVALVRAGDGEPQRLQPKGHDDYGLVYQIKASHNTVFVKFAEDVQDGETEDDNLWRAIPARGAGALREVWLRGWHMFVHTRPPRKPESNSAAEYLGDKHFVANTYTNEDIGCTALGANLLQGGGAMFGMFHPHAAQVYVAGDFNEWQHPDAENADELKFIPLALHRGYFDVPNIWLAQVDHAKAGDQYKFYIVYDAIASGTTLQPILTTDPYARVFGADYERNDSVIVDPSGFGWEDGDYRTPAIHDLILYELHVHGFTHDHPDIAPEHQGTYQGVLDRLRAGYFDKVGATCLYLMPLGEAPTPQGPTSMGYNTSVFTTVERDFGTPDELRTLVNEAHKAGIAVIADQVFNHSANEFNPLWKLILDHPDEWGRGEEGGLYFSGSSPWGNRIATERAEVQNMLIDTCKLLLTEYHMDGFRFDYTHSYTMDHGFLNRLADVLQAIKPDVILIAENMPNEPDLNRAGYNGFGQWCNFFHDTIKALLREGEFEGEHPDPHAIGDIFYFSKAGFAAHTNNVVNYCESHDENSVAFEVGFSPGLDSPQARERKARLGLFSTFTALGQPMIYMGQEFGLVRERNQTYFPFPDNLDDHGFFQWASRLMRLRRRYPALKLHGYNPIEDEQFEWIAGSWLDEKHGGGARVIAWRSEPNEHHHDTIVVALNFENHDIAIDLELGLPGKWVRLASIDSVNDIAPDGTNHADDATALYTEDGRVEGFVLQDSSGYVYKWEGA